MGKNRANSRKIVKTKNLPKNWVQKFEKMKLILMSKTFKLILIIPTSNT
jgi:hypothetical protein